MKFDHFSILAPFYEHFIPPHNPTEIIELLDLPEKGVVLDAGGGTGRVAQFFLNQSGQIIVADHSCAMVREAGKKVGLRGVCTSTEELPFADLTIDRIIMVDALHHVSNQAATCRELLRILKPGGRIVIEEPDIRSFGVKLIALAEKLAFMRSHFISPLQISGLFNFPNIHTQVIHKDSTAWIIIDKALNE
ncbi:MAG: class I SAM-dependent methyltransferase [Anaerolineaceae bacterium]